MDKKGTIDISQLNKPPEKHEFETAKYFAGKGKDIVFLPTSNIPNMHTPDILMDGNEWEIKCPSGLGKKNIARNFHNAAAQSDHIIFDMRRSKLPESESIARLEKEFKARPYIKRLLIIKRNGELIEF